MWRAVYLVPGRDNVATAVQPLTAGERVELEGLGAITVLDPIPFGHKFAITDIEPGDLIVKYGHAIGRATKPISVGQHVHVHNVAGSRGRGDLVAKMRDERHDD